MTEQNQEIVFGVTGQSVTMDAPEGRPTSVVSATVWSVWSDDESTPEAALGTPTVEAAPNTTTTAEAGFDGADRTAIAVTSATGVAVGRQYKIESTNGDSEWFAVAAVDGATVYTRHPLLNVYPAGSAVLSTRMVADIDATWVADKTKLSSETDAAPQYRIAWVYVVDGATVRRQSYFTLSRYKAEHSVTAIDVDDSFPGWIDRLPPDHKRDQGVALIAAAWKAVRLDLLGDAKAARWVRHADVVNELVICKAIEKLAELQVSYGAATLDAQRAARENYRQRYDQLIREPHVHVGSSSGGGAEHGTAEPIFRR